MFDLHLEAVRDFGKYFFLPNDQGINRDFNFQGEDQTSFEKNQAELLDNSSSAI